MNLKQLEYFVRVAELGSFSKAALILNIAQPALSRQVRLLETDLHATLLQRTGRGEVLTEAGKRLFDHSIGILQLVSRVREDIASSRDEPAGRLVVGLPPSMGRLLTLPLVEEFRRVLPKARLAIVEGLSTHLSEWISTGRVDLGLLHNPESQAANTIALLHRVAGNSDRIQYSFEVWFYEYAPSWLQMIKPLNAGSCTEACICLKYFYGSIIRRKPGRFSGNR